MKKLALIIFFDAFLLILLGLIIVMSASSAYSEFKFDNLFRLFNYHLLKVLIGLGLMIIFSFVPYDIYKQSSKPAIFAIVFVLFITLFVAKDINGAGRWLQLGPFSFQPTNAARLILFIHLAALMEDKGAEIKSYKNGFLYLFFWVIVISVLILLQPNVSNGILLVFISLVIMYVGGAKIKHILVAALFCLVAGGIAAMLFFHSRERILAFIHTIEYGGALNLQVWQSFLGLGSGGVFGVGLGHSLQSNLFLPEAYGDFIFSILGEEIGFIGAISVLFAYLVMFIAGILVAKKARDKFGQLLAFGITFSIIVYAFVNIAVAVGLIPTTGLPLPFISYGGTSLIFLSISIGILINIAIANSIPQNLVEQQQINSNIIEGFKA